MTALPISIDLKPPLTHSHWQIDWFQGIWKKSVFIIHPNFWVCSCRASGAQAVQGENILNVFHKDLRRADTEGRKWTHFDSGGSIGRVWGTDQRSMVPTNLVNIVVGPGRGTWDRKNPSTLRSKSLEHSRGQGLPYPPTPFPCWGPFPADAEKHAKHARKYT